MRVGDSLNQTRTPANFGFLLARRRSPAAFSSLQRGSQLVLETPFQFGTAGQLAIGSQTVIFMSRRLLFVCRKAFGDPALAARMP